MRTIRGTRLTFVGIRISRPLLYWNSIIKCLRFLFFFFEGCGLLDFHIPRDSVQKLVSTTLTFGIVYFNWPDLATCFVLVYGLKRSAPSTDIIYKYVQFSKKDNIMDTVSLETISYYAFEVHIIIGVYWQKYINCLLYYIYTLRHCNL